MRVLLVEDNDLSRELFSDVLNDDGHEVETARDGITGRSLGLARRYDIILLDLHLPGIPGEQVCRELRAAGVRTPIVAVSASAMPAEIEQAMRSGFDAYLTKPIQPSVLRRTLQAHVSVGAAGATP